MEAESGTGRYKAVLFDLDGTLLDTLDDLTEAMNRVLKKRGFPTRPSEAYRYLIGEGTVFFVTGALPEEHREEETIRTCLEEFRTDYGQNWKVKTRPYPGVAEMLEAIAAHGLKMAILSNKPDFFVQPCVKQLLPQWNFAVVLGQRDGVPPKPDPTGALDVSDRLRVAPERFLYLGDSGVDMKTACAAGMSPIGALWGFRSAQEMEEGGAKALIKYPLEILGFLD
jgi:phosphoglycolate phosphatase